MSYTPFLLASKQRQCVIKPIIIIIINNIVQHMLTTTRPTKLASRVAMNRTHNVEKINSISRLLLYFQRTSTPFGQTASHIHRAILLFMLFYFSFYTRRQGITPTSQSI